MGRKMGKSRLSSLSTKKYVVLPIIQNCVGWAKYKMDWKWIKTKLKGGVMKRNYKIILVLVFLVFMVGCAQQSWQAKGTAIYVGAGDTMKTADKTFQELKTAGLVTTDQVAKYNGIYKKAYDAYWLAGDGWKLALMAGPDIEQQKYLEAFYKNFGDFQKFVGDLVAFVNGIIVKQKTGGAK